MKTPSPSHKPNDCSLTVLFVLFLQDGEGSAAFAILSFSQPLSALCQS